MGSTQMNYCQQYVFNFLTCSMSSQNSNIELVSWNVNGLRACREEKEHLISLLRRKT